MNWEEYSIEKLCVKVTDGAHFSPQEFPGGYPMASSKDMSENDFDLSNVKTISEQDYLKLVSADCKPLVGDVLLIKDGNSYLKSIFQVKEERELVVLSSIAMLRPKQAIIYPLFFQYALRNPVAKKQMENFVSGAAIPRIVLKDFKQMKVLIPSLPVQQKIASILSAYDDLIENNLKRIRLLEEAAQNLYREWFVKFRFPGWEEVQVVDGLPEGWELKGFEEVSKNNNKRRIPLSSMEREKMKGKYPYYGATGIFDFVNQYLFEGRFLLIAEDGSVIDKNGLPVLQLVEGQFWVNNHAHIINGESLPTEFLYLAMKNQPIGHLVTGAVQPKLSMQNLRKVEVIKPEKTILEQFMAFVLPMINQVFILNLQNQKLKTARDLLLPRLMNQTIAV